MPGSDAIQGRSRAELNLNPMLSGKLLRKTCPCLSPRLRESPIKAEGDRSATGPRNAEAQARSNPCE